VQRIAVLLLSPFFSCHRVGRRPAARWRTVWRVSQALLAGADAADAASSWGKNEANPLVRAGQRFSYGSLAIKLGALTGGVVAQHFILRKAPYNTVVRIRESGRRRLLGVAAEHNMHVPR
jgi:hypothetical protein